MVSLPDFFFCCTQGFSEVMRKFQSGEGDETVAELSNNPVQNPDEIAAVCLVVDKKMTCYHWVIVLCRIDDTRKVKQVGEPLIHSICIGVVPALTRCCGMALRTGHLSRMRVR